MSLEAYEAWNDVAAKQHFMFDKKKRHFRKGRWDDPLAGLETLPIESGLCQAMHQQTVWGVEDGPRVFAHWQVYHAKLFTELFKDAKPELAGLQSRFVSVHDKTGTSWAAGHCMLTHAKTAEQQICSLVVGEGFVKREVKMTKTTGKGRGRKKVATVQLAHSDARYSATTAVLNHYQPIEPVVAPATPSPSIKPVNHMSRRRFFGAAHPA